MEKKIIIFGGSSGIGFELVKYYLNKKFYVFTTYNKSKRDLLKFKKVYRDKFMINLAKKFSNYAWERNFGYGTKDHLEGLKKFGVTSHHRKGFKPVYKILSG